MANWRSPWAKNIVWLFCGFFGYTFVISDEGLDAFRYRESLIELHHSDITFTQYASQIISGESGRGDYLEPIVRYLISLFTDDYRVLFAAFGLIMGFYYSRNIWFLLENAGRKIQPLPLFLLMFFIFAIAFWQINGFRFWTAAHIFVYGVINLFYKDKKFLGIGSCLLAVATHSAFISGLALAIGHYFLPKRRSLYVIFFLLSFFYFRLNLTTILSLIPAQYFESKMEIISSYTHESYLALREAKVQKQRWFLTLNSLGQRALVFLTISYIFFFRWSRTKYLKLDSIFLFGVLLYAMTSSLSEFPSFARFYKVSLLLIVGCLFVVVNRRSIRSIDLLYLTFAIPPIILAILVELRIGAEFMGPSTFIYNPLIAVLLDTLEAFIYFYK